MGAPNPTPGNNCITIFDCAPGTCNDGSDTAIGTGSVDGAGNFVIDVSPPLVANQQIYATDTCNGVTGPDVLVRSTGQIPDVTPWGAALLAAALLIAMAVRVRLAKGSAARRRR